MEFSPEFSFGTYGASPSRGLEAFMNRDWQNVQVRGALGATATLMTDVKQCVLPWCVCVCVCVYVCVCVI
jgi:hypothetical protein